MNTRVICRGDYINASKLVSQFENNNGNKCYKEWKRTKSSADVFESVSQAEHIPVSKLSFNVETGPNEYRGAYVHEKLIIAIMTWASPKFYNTVYNIMIERANFELEIARRTQVAALVNTVNEKQQELMVKDDAISKLQSTLDQMKKDMDDQMQKIASNTDKIIVQNKTLKLETQDLNAALKDTTVKLNTISDQLCETEDHLIETNDHLIETKELLHVVKDQNDKLLNENVDLTIAVVEKELTQEQLEQALATKRTQVDELVDQISNVAPRYVPPQDDNLAECVVFMLNPTTRAIKSTARQVRSLNQGISTLKKQGYTQEVIRVTSPNSKDMRHRLVERLTTQCSRRQVIKFSITELRLGTATPADIVRLINEIEQERLNVQ